MTNISSRTFLTVGIILGAAFLLSFSHGAWADGKWTGSAAAPSGWTSSVSLIAKADVAAGKSKANECSACHSFNKGEPDKIGPNLYNVVNSLSAHDASFSYSDALKALDKKRWTYDALDNFLFSPADYVPGTKMPYAGIKGAQDRANVIAYLRSLSDHPAPLPK
jgi:cytochrome c